MGILNVTPDSFSDGGRFTRLDASLAHAREMIAAGADIIDVGGESTRPGAADVPVDLELERVLPVIEGIREFSDIPLSVDTSKPEVMIAAVAAGVDLVNDVYGLRRDGALEAAARSGAAVCLMHMQGEPRTMQEAPQYADVVAEVVEFLAERVKACAAAGIDRDRLIVDPGFGFGKTLAHNVSLLDGLEAFRRLGCPVLVGMSRKRMVRDITGCETHETLPGNIAVAIVAAVKGASVLRVHDVRETVQALQTVATMRRPETD
jgi:dihydropteroate synthase